MIGASSTAEAVLLSIEECLRAQHEAPDEKLLLEWCSGSVAQAHLALLTQHAVWVRSGRPELSPSLRAGFEGISNPDGDSLLGRVRDQMLNS